MRKEIDAFLEPLDGELEPIREFTLRYVDATAAFDEKTGALLLDHTPEIGSEARTVVVFPGLSNDQIDRYRELEAKARRSPPIHIPDSYREVLRRMNGAHIAGMSLFGIPTSMLKDPPLLDRASWQPIDVGSSNQTWRAVRRVDPRYFFIGASYWTYEENVEYFLEPTGQVSAYLRNDELVGSYSSMELFLATELTRLEASLAKRNQREADFRRQLEATKKTKVLARLRSWLFGNP